MKLLIRIGVFLLILLLLVIFLKPSHGRFKEYVGDRDANGYKLETRKVADYLLYAVYEKSAFKTRNGNYVLKYTESFTGYLLNFHQTTHREIR